MSERFVKTNVFVGPLKYSKGGIVVLSRYNNNMRLAILLQDGETGEPICTASVNVMEVFRVEPNQCFIKDYSENEGVADALVSAGVMKVVDTAPTALGPYAITRLYELTEKMQPWYDQLIAPPKVVTPPYVRIVSEETWWEAVDSHWDNILKIAHLAGVISRQIEMMQEAKDERLMDTLHSHLNGVLFEAPDTREIHSWPSWNQFCEILSEYRAWEVDE